MIKAMQIQHDGMMEAALGLAKEAGFEYVSLGFGSSKLFFSDDWEREIERINTILDKLGLKCALTHLYYRNLTVSSEIKDEATDEAIRRCIRATAMLGADRTALHTRTRFVREGVYDSDGSMADNAEHIRGLIPTAREAGVTVAIENLPKFEKYPLYPNTTDELLALYDELSDPSLGICWDFGHAQMNGTDQVDALRRIGKSLAVTHIHDNFGNDDHHLVPGVGVADWKTLMKTLSEIGYNGPFMLEVVYPRDSTLGAFLKYCYASISRLEELMEE